MSPVERGTEGTGPWHGDEPPRTVLIEVTTELLEQWLTRDNAGNRLSMVLGEPTDQARVTRYGSTDVLSIYTPTITTHPEDNPWTSHGETEVAA